MYFVIESSQLFLLVYKVLIVEQAVKVGILGMCISRLNPGFLPIGNHIVQGNKDQKYNSDRQGHNEKQA